jgi:hypothetical protein
MPRPRHPSKEIEAAVQFAESAGWTVEISNGHAWGHLLCPQHSRDGCMVSIWSTPRNRQNHANGIRRAVARCSHGEGSEE